MFRPKVSVIMNCLNGEKHLREAIESVMAQTFTDFEIVFWDNCSTDKSAEIAQEYTGKLRYFRGDHIVPLGEGRNLALAQAQGEYIAFLDCDDLWTEDKLERQVALFEQDSALGLVCTDTIVFDAKRDLRRVFATAAPARGMVFEELITRQWISMSSAMLRWTALTSLSSSHWFDETLNVCEEADVFYRIAHDWKLDYVDAPCTRWRIHGNNTTLRKFGQFAEETRKILAKHRKLYPGYDSKHAAIVRLLEKRSAFEEAVALWQQGKGREARKALGAWRKENRKYRLFWWATFLPSCFFTIAATCYFALPRLFKS